MQFGHFLLKNKQNAKPTHVLGLKILAELNEAFSFSEKLF